MTKRRTGIVTLAMLVAAIGIGAWGIAGYSVTAAAGYLAVCGILTMMFMYAYCAKCPVRGQCVHVVMGLMTRLIPSREEMPYTSCESIVVLAFFGFVALFPQYWLVQEPVLLILFWALFIGEWVLAFHCLCPGCGNRFCRFRRDAQ